MFQVPEWLIVLVINMVLLIKLNEVLFNKDIIDNSWPDCFSFFFGLSFALEALGDF